MSEVSGESPRAMRWFVQSIAGLAALCLLVAIASLATQVVARYGLGGALTWPEELAKFCFVWATFLGAAAGAGQRAHIAVELVVNKLPERLHLAVSTLTNGAIFLLLVVLVRHGVSLVILGLNSRLPAINFPLGTLFLAGTVGLGLMAIIFAYETVRTASALVSGRRLATPDVDPAQVIG
ncbi:TRAP transporter small permease [Acuticoccus kandeliae]|uniref:TRAP transporter small permease n=1 Tax=Acuticoccus kandeliae TaxID=2073160 RepID=UPI001300B0B4|nr:TRAP transporter small permease [Acuticoccus kandeliae]